MKRFALLLLTVLSPILLVGQNITMRSTTKSSEPESLDLSSYDGKSPFFDLQVLNKHPHYYDGQKILFLPNSSDNYQFYSDFTLVEPKVIADTVWNKNHTKIKKINTSSNDVYKAIKVEDGQVRDYWYPTLTGTGSITTQSGFFTPKDMIEGKAFTILSAESKTVEERMLSITYFSIILKDGDGELIKWDLSSWLYGGKYVFMPIIMYSIFEKYNSFVGNTYVFNNQKYPPVAQEYVCTELSFVDQRRISDPSTAIGYFYSPVLFFKTQGKEVQFDILPEKHYGYLRSRESLTQSTVDMLTEKSVYLVLKAEADEARLQRARADSLAKVERAAQLQREKEERAAQEAERYARLKKKYGKTNADLIVNGEVRLGWSREMCREAWGDPEDINTSIGAWGTHEQWVYYSSYLYFENGKLTSIQL